MKSVDQTGRIVTLQDGIQFTLPDTVRINPDNIPTTRSRGDRQGKLPGFRDGKKMATAIEVRLAT